MNERVDVVELTTLHDGWSRLLSAVIDYRRADGQVQRLVREVHDHGNAAAMILFDPARRTVLLVRQFRFPPTLNGDPGAMLEVCAGLLDGDDPQTCAIREAEEETGHRPHSVRHVCDIYVSPGSVTEKVALFVGHYDAGTFRHVGGGLVEEGEEIELVEMSLEAALAMIGNGGIVDAKTILLLQHLALAGL